MENAETLHIEAQNAIALLKQEARLFLGPIMPRFLAAAIPHMDELALLVLCEILSAHRPNKAGQVYWKGALYQVNLAELARQYRARYTDVSRALSFLEKHQLIRLAHRGRKNHGLWGGSQVFAVPRIGHIVRIHQRFDAKCGPLFSTRSGVLSERRTTPTQGFPSRQANGVNEPENDRLNTMVIKSIQPPRSWTIEIDGTVHNILKADVERVVPNPHLIGLNSTVRPTSPAGKSVARLKLATSSCRVRLLLSDRCLIYITSWFLPPQEVAAIDTQSKLLYTLSGARVPAKLFVFHLSLIESVFVQNEIRNAEDKKRGEVVDKLTKDLEAVTQKDLARKSMRQSKRSGAYMFRKAGQFWTVVFDGGKEFHIKDNLGARYVDCLLHHPYKPITALDLESAVQAEKTKVRDQNSIQKTLDGQATREYLREIERKRAELESAKQNADFGAADTLEEDIIGLESELKKRRHMRDSGERARDNVRKAITALSAKCANGDKSEKAFGQHLDQYISKGYTLNYSPTPQLTWE